MSYWESLKISWYCLWRFGGPFAPCWFIYRYLPSRSGIGWAVRLLLPILAPVFLIALLLPNCVT
jgi:hypothetical protein